ncbi:MAG: cell division protein FtsH [Blastopirellula sp.]|nr:cell division protein FtsH [Blastopirellula sp.]
MDKPNRDQDLPNEGQPRRGPAPWMLALLLVGVAGVLLFYLNDPHSELKYSDFLRLVQEGKVLSIELGTTVATGKFKTPLPDAPEKINDQGELEPDLDAKGKPKKLNERFRVTLGSESGREKLEQLLEQQGVQVTNAGPDNTFMLFWAFTFFLSIAVLLYFWMSFRKTRDQIMGGGFLSGFNKSPAKRFEASAQPITFDDVAGLEGVKADLQEIVEFLMTPEKFARLGGRVPKGVLLNGPPGTGKTLLARAVAGEAGVPFFSVNGSEFIQMFVGVGASRVRDLFKTARENSPAIIFIDEIDAVGRQRGAGLGGGHDEREQTLNQILSEMDGFNPSEATIVVAATNRPDVLDPALLRPGRFDRHVTVGKPTLNGRYEIFKVHVRDVPLADQVDLKRLAANTIGLTGADIRNIVNEAALWAARHDKTVVEMDDFEYARDKILMGAKREEVMTEEEKRKTAYHEIGHTLAAWHLPGAYRVHKVTVIPRGRALGVTQMMPSEDKMSAARHELLDQLVGLLAGRAAEKIVYDETSIGAENDLERATGIARRMVTHWGMSDKLGPVSYKLSDEDPFLGREMHKQREFSEHTMEQIDAEVSHILHHEAQRAFDLLQSKRDELECLTDALVEREELSEQEITDLIGPSVHSDSASAAESEEEAVATNQLAPEPGDDV